MNFSLDASVLPFCSTGARWAIYTCVIGNYDKVLPPINITPGADYILFTDSVDLVVDGWKVIPIEISHEFNSSLQNRHCKVFPERYLSGYEASIYVDGNVRIKGSLERIFKILDRGYDIVLLQHPRRSSVSDEVDACISLNKVVSADLIAEEYRTIINLGFKELGYLTENNVIVRRHSADRTDLAMNEWWKFLIEFSGRDQISLLFCLSLFECSTMVLPFCTRDVNPFFYRYLHFKDFSTSVSRFVFIFNARRGESLFFEAANIVANYFYRKALRLSSKLVGWLR